MSKICQNCNAEMAENMNFCPSCRTKYIELQQQNIPLSHQSGITPKFPLDFSVNIALGLSSVLGGGSMILYWFNSDNEDWIFDASHNFLIIAFSIIIWGLIPIILVASVDLTKMPMPWGKPSEVTSKIWGSVISTAVFSIIMASIVLIRYSKCL